jgi:hypothetical protein
VGAGGASVASVAPLGASVAGGRTVASGIVGAWLGRDADDEGLADPDPEPQPTANSTTAAATRTRRTQGGSTPPSSSPGHGPRAVPSRSASCTPSSRPPGTARWPPLNAGSPR